LEHGSEKENGSSAAQPMTAATAQDVKPMRNPLTALVSDPQPDPITFDPSSPQVRESRHEPASSASSSSLDGLPIAHLPPDSVPPAGSTQTPAAPAVVSTSSNLPGVLATPSRGGQELLVASAAKEDVQPIIRPTPKAVFSPGVALLAVPVNSGEESFT